MPSEHEGSSQEMVRATQHQPGEPASETGLYREVNVFGTPTGLVVQARRGEALPHAPRGFAWLLTDDGSQQDRSSI